MKEGYFYDIINEEKAIEYLNKEDENSLLFFSPTSLQKINFYNIKSKMENWHDISKERKRIDEYIKTLKGIKRVVTLGGGSTIDIGKYIAFKLKIEHVCIPTMLSTNSYATDKVALIEDGKKMTIQAKMPEKIIIDNDILKLSSKENLYGLADVLSIYTALEDWKIANNDINEKIDKQIYVKAEKLLKEVLDFIKVNTIDEINSKNMELFNFIGRAGYITNIYGTGRPESGSEHIMAKEIESVVDVPHGISVSIGILLMTLLQGRGIEKILAAIKKLNILQNCAEYGITKEMIKECFLKLKPRLDRYTVINRYERNNEIREEKIKKFFEVIKG